jgi:hypothetical protein
VGKRHPREARIHPGPLLGATQLGTVPIPRSRNSHDLYQYARTEDAGCMLKEIT